MRSIFDRLFLALLVWVARAPSFADVTLNPDEGIYLVAAREVLAGNLPYTTLFLERPLGAQLVFALVAWLFGTTLLPLRILGAIAVTATTLILREIALRAGLSRVMSLVPAILYALFSTRLGGLATNMEILFLPFNAAAFWVAISHIQSRSHAAQCRAVLLMGACIGLSIWLKFIAVLTGCALFAWLIGSYLIRRTADWQWVILLAMQYGIVCAAPMIAGGLFYWWLGAWDAFWTCNVGFMRSYQAVDIEPFVMLGSIFDSVLSIAPLLILSACSIFDWRRGPALLIGLGAWFTAELTAVLLPWKFYDHYFLLLLPVLCLLAGIRIAALVERSAVSSPFTMLLLATYLVIEAARSIIPWQILGNYQIPVFMTLLAGSWIVVFRWSRSAEAPTRQGMIWPALARSAPSLVIAVVIVLGPAWLRAGRPDAIHEIAGVIKSESAPKPTVWVINSDPLLYTLAGAAIPTRFAFPQALTGAFTAVAGIDPEAEVSRILATRPRYLVVEPQRWGVARTGVAHLVREALERNYELVTSLRRDSHEIQLYRARAS